MPSGSKHIISICDCHYFLGTPLKQLNKRVNLRSKVKSSYFCASLLENKAYEATMHYPEVLRDDNLPRKFYLQAGNLGFLLLLKYDYKMV